jgi:hypothetical protein
LPISAINPPPSPPSFLLGNTETEGTPNQKFPQAMSRNFEFTGFDLRTGNISSNRNLFLSIQLIECERKIFFLNGIADNVISRIIWSVLGSLNNSLFLKARFT